MFNLRKRLLQVGTAALAAAAIPMALTPSAFAASATLVSTTGSALVGTQASTTPFVVQLPNGAACSEASSVSAIRVGSYMVDNSQFSNPAALTYNSAGNIQEYSLYDGNGSTFVNANTQIPNAAGQGPVNQPGPLSFSLFFGSFDPTGNYTTDNPTTGNSQLYPGVFNIGIACYNSSNASIENGTIPANGTDGANYWNVQIQVTASTTDPNGFTYSVYSPTPQTPEVPFAVILPLSAVGVAGLGVLVLRRRRNSSTVAA